MACIVIALCIGSIALVLSPDRRLKHAIGIDVSGVVSVDEVTNPWNIFADDQLYLVECDPETFIAELMHQGFTKVEDAQQIRFIAAEIATLDPSIRVGNQIFSKGNFPPIVYVFRDSLDPRKVYVWRADI
ncbi:MAG TPA: hypothetical protein PK402_10010 [Tepidisphaeraceae bacterium]|nr:hypothetical protein [Tepidisphaeraceae bacterium]